MSEAPVNIAGLKKVQRNWADVNVLCQNLIQLKVGEWSQKFSGVKVNVFY